MIFLNIHKFVVIKFIIQYMVIIFHFKIFDTAGNNINLISVFLKKAIRTLKSSFSPFVIRIQKIDNFAFCIF